VKGGLEGVAVSAAVPAKEEFNGHGLREFGRCAPAAVAPIVGVEQVFDGGVEVRLCEGGVGGAVQVERLPQVVEDFFADAGDFGWLFLPGAGDARQDVFEGGHVVARHGREVGAGVEGFQVGGEEDGHGPSAGAGHGDGGLHVDGVEVGAFFAVHFDVDEVFVHEGGGGGVFEGFVRHDMTPVTGGVSDAEEDGFVFGAGFCKRFFAPGVPVHRVIRVLEQVGGIFVN